MTQESEPTIKTPALAEEEQPPARPPGYKELFWIFFKAGLAFGGGLGILAVLEDELVTRRRAVTRDNFLTLYGLGRIVPSGTMTALAVAYGYRFGRLPGTAIALIAMALPPFVTTIALTIAYGYLKQGPFLELLPLTVLPAALAFIVAAALKLGKNCFRPSLDALLAGSAFIGVVVFDLNPALLLVLGGLAGILLFRQAKGEAQ